jgi:hypothetical protein
MTIGREEHFICYEFPTVIETGMEKLYGPLCRQYCFTIVYYSIIHDMVAGWIGLGCAKRIGGKGVGVS